jgi:hypothetical protein
MEDGGSLKPSSVYALPLTRLQSELARSVADQR